MLDQMFTAENFREIFDLENRKGRDLASLFFPNLKQHTKQIRDKTLEIRQLRKIESSLKAEEFEEKIKKLKAELSQLKEIKSAAIDMEMENLAKAVAGSEFKIQLHKTVRPKQKTVYCIDKKPEAFFVTKQLQRNLSKLYKVKQANRHDLVSQLRDVVGSQFPYEIVRTDIRSFYESIDRKRLLTKLDEDPLLSPSSKKYIKQILDSYGSITGNSTGIPRGVGISAYLAEIFIRPVDKEIRKIPGLVLYCRYVDDIVAVFARPLEDQSLQPYQARLSAILSEYNLEINIDKTVEQKINVSPKFQFDYLGYTFRRVDKKLQIYPTRSKIKKYRSRILLSFKAYENERSQNSRRAYRQLVARIKFLTGNARLLNSKSSAATGIYFNNSLVNQTSFLELLDRILKREIEKVRRPKLRERLKKYSFLSGFTDRRFHNFSTHELRSIIEAWKHD